MLVPVHNALMRRQTNRSGVGSATFGTAVTTGAASGTKGTPVQLISSTSFDAYAVEIFAEGYGSSAVASAGSMDLLIGAATESVLIADLLFGACGGVITQHVGPKRWFFPLYIPAGSRLAVQAAGLRTSTAFDVAIYLYGGNGYPPFRVGTKVDTYGVSAVPNGTTVVVGATGAEGSWTQITASTSRDHFCLVPSWQTNDSTMTLAQVSVDIGFGAATEVELGSFDYFSAAIESIEGPWQALPIFGDFPAASRLVMRASSSGAADTSNGAIHGVS